MTTREKLADALWTIAALVGVLLVLGCPKHPLGQWAPVGSKPLVTIVNQLDVTCTAVVENQEGYVRVLGTIPPADSATFVIPLADQQIQLTVCHAVTLIDVDGPKHWRTVLRYKP